MSGLESPNINVKSTQPMLIIPIVDASTRLPLSQMDTSCFKISNGATRRGEYIDGGCVCIVKNSF